MKGLIVFGFLPCLLLSASLSWAQKPVAAAAKPISNNVSLDKPQPIHFMLAYGSELRPEKDIDSNYKEHFLTNYALGFGYEQFVFVFEKAEFKETSGNATLNLERTLEDYLLWAQYRSMTWNRLVPFLGVGLGTYKETVVTQFAGASTTDSTPSKFLSGLAFGVGLDIPVLWFSLEARFLFGDELERQPTLGGLARIGVHF